MNAWEVLINPQMELNGRKWRIPVKVMPDVTAQIGYRLNRARKRTCKLVDRRTRNWSHFQYESKPQFRCTCLSQTKLAKAFRIDQTTLSRIEHDIQGGRPNRPYSSSRKQFPRHMDLSAFIRIFGSDLAFWILTGQELNKPEIRKE